MSRTDPQSLAVHHISKGDAMKSQHGYIIGGGGSGGGHMY
jgi:hypothetical protein